MKRFLSKEGFLFFFCFFVMNFPTKPSFLNTSNDLIRNWNCSDQISSNDLIYPIFISCLVNEFTEIKKLPNQYKMGINKLKGFLQPLVDIGLSSVLLFIADVPDELKDDTGSFASNQSNQIFNAIQLLKTEFPSLIVCVDVCLCAYTTHGHCGILNNLNYIDNLKSITRIAEIAGCYSLAGCDIVAPSDMVYSLFN